MCEILRKAHDKSAVKKKNNCIGTSKIVQNTLKMTANSTSRTDESVKKVTEMIMNHR